MESKQPNPHALRRGITVLVCAMAIAFTATLHAQLVTPEPSQIPQLPAGQSSSNPSAPGTPTSVTSAAPTQSEMSSRPAPNAQQTTPAAIDPAGPATSLETSESVFDVMAALNTCGYNEGLAKSDPLRQKVRDEINETLEKSEPARESRDHLCAFIQSHTLNSTKLNLASYISLALFLAPPPQLAPNVPTADLPPDAGPLVDLAPLLRTFSRAVDLHLIWVLNREGYDAQVVKVHEPLARLLVQTDVYLKQPPPGYGSRRFLVILEPLIAPGEVNARVYGADYIVVESPVNGQIDLKPVKHTYLRFILEPLIYARSQSIDKLAPILELVQPSPLAFQYKSDILSLVTECMIRAIEARTMETGIPEYKIPAHVERNQLAAVDEAENAYEHKVAAVRNAVVRSDMTQGFILTQYFFEQLRAFEQNSTRLGEAVGVMVYGMNVEVEKRRVQDIVFSAQTDQDVAAPVSAPVATQSALLDQGERKLIAGDTAGAAQLARQALDANTSNPGRAQFLLARADIMSGKMEAAEQAFTQSAQLSHDLRTIAWSHIYLGRLADVQGDRPRAIVEYQAALKTRDGKSDTTKAAQAGLDHPFGPGPRSSNATTSEDDDAPQEPSTPAANVPRK